MSAIETSDVMLSISAMRAAAGETAAVLRVLSNEDRLLLLCQMSQGEWIAILTGMKPDFFTGICFGEFQA